MVPPPKRRKPRRSRTITKNTDSKMRAVEVVRVAGKVFVRRKRLKYH